MYGTPTPVLTGTWPTGDCVPPSSTSWIPSIRDRWWLSCRFYACLRHLRSAQPASSPAAVYVVKHCGVLRLSPLPGFLACLDEMLSTSRSFSQPGDLRSGFHASRSLHCVARATSFPYGRWADGQRVSGLGGKGQKSSKHVRRV